MQGQGSGSIINISSTYGHEGAAGASVYVGNRAAHLEISEMLADVSPEVNGEAAGGEGGVEETPVASNLGLK